jgi:uncharacterized membrane protein
MEVGYIGYIGGLLGISLGSLGAITGIAGSYARKEPEKYLRSFRSLLLADSIIGFALVAIGVIMRLLVSSDHFKIIAEVIWSSGALLLVAIGGVATEFFGKWRIAQVSIYTAFLSGAALLVLGIESLHVPAKSGDAIRQLSQAAVLLIVCAVLWLLIIKKKI